MVILLGLLARMAIPAFNRALERNRFRNAYLNLIALHGAVLIYRANHGGLYDGALAGLNNINNEFNTNVVDTDDAFAYAYNGIEAANTFTITANRDGLACTITITQAAIAGTYSNQTNPTSAGADCPY